MSEATPEQCPECGETDIRTAYDTEDGKEYQCTNCLHNIADPSQPFGQVQDEDEGRLVYNQGGSVYPVLIETVHGRGRVDRAELHNTVFDGPQEYTREQFNEYVENAQHNRETEEDKQYPAIYLNSDTEDE